MATIGLDKLYYASITEDENGDETFVLSVAVGCKSMAVHNVCKSYFRVLFCKINFYQTCVPTGISFSIERV